MVLRKSFVCAAVLTLAACGGGSQASPQSASVSAPAASVSASAASSVAAARSASPALAASASSVPAATSSAASASQAGAIKLTLGSDSQMDITMHELLAGNAAQTNAVETSKTVSGSIMLDSQGNVQPGSKISMDLRTLQSDRQIRDNFIKRVTLQTNQFPMVDFVPNQVQGLDGGLPASGQRSFKLLGDATVRGETHQMTWDVTATFTSDGCQGTATAPLKLSDFGLTPPKAGPVISVDDAGSIALKFQAVRSAAA